jgi:hypothetical protein
LGIGAAVGYTAGAAGFLAGAAVVGAVQHLAHGAEGAKDGIARHRSRMVSRAEEQKRQAEARAAAAEIAMQTALTAKSNFPKYWSVHAPKKQGLHMHRIGILEKALLKSIQAVCTPADITKLGSGPDCHDPFNAGGLPKVAAAWCVQNPALWQKFLGARGSVVNTCKQLSKRGELAPMELQREFCTTTGRLPGAAGMLRQANEVYLCHTPNPDALHSILEGGFNERFAGTNAGTAFGDGTYFAGNHIGFFITAISMTTFATDVTLCV